MKRKRDTWNEADWDELEFAPEDGLFARIVGWVRTLIGRR